MRRNHFGRLLALTVTVACIPGLCAAQSTGTPVYQAPYRAFARSEIGISVSDPGAGWSFEGEYRTSFSRQVDLGFRGGFHDLPGLGAGNLLLLGVDLRARVLSHTEALPLDGAFTVGLGLESGHGTTVGFLPIGFTMGRRVLVEGSSISLVPYLQPVLTVLLGDADGTQFSFGFGLDARITPRLDLRFSSSVGDRDGVSFTIAFLR